MFVSTSQENRLIIDTTIKYRYQYESSQLLGQEIRMFFTNNTSICFETPSSTSIVVFVKLQGHIFFASLPI
jgi:hypothetical protein